MNLFNKFLGAAVLASATQFAFAAKTPEGWTDNYQAALKQAKEEKKVVVVNFTGSDWCGWCIRLMNEVFNKEEFKKAAKDKYVMLYIDSPRSKEGMSPELIEQNKSLVKKYNVRGYPTILLLDADGKVVSQTGYKQGGPDIYVAHLDELFKSSEVFTKEIAEAQKLTGIEKAKKLDAALSKLDAMKQATYKQLMEEIVTIDSDNAAGLRNKYLMPVVFMPKFTSLINEINKKYDAIFMQLNTLSRDPEKKEEFEKLEKEVIQKMAAESVAIREAVIKLAEGYDLKGEAKQGHLCLVAQTYMMARDFPKAIEIMEQAIKEAPESSSVRRISAQLNYMKAQAQPKKK